MTNLAVALDYDETITNEGFLAWLGDKQEKHPSLLMIFLKV